MAKNYNLKTKGSGRCPKQQTGKMLCNLGLAVAGGLLMIRACRKPGEKVKTEKQD